MPLTNLGGDLRNIFISEADILDRLVGNQLWVWGNNTQGQLGNNTITNCSLPTQTVSVGMNWTFVSSGYQSMAGIKCDGTLWLWGSNNCGVLGNNSTINQSSPVQTISGGNNWKCVSISKHTAAIKTDGTLWMWGCNTYGKMGDNSTVAKSSPVQTIAGGNNWKSVCAGRCFTAAIKTDGTLWMWGANQYGQLGNCSTVFASSPVQTISGGTNWKQVTLIVGTHSAMAIKCDGTLWGWGRTSGGITGIDCGGWLCSPIQTIVGGTNWKQISESSGIKTDGTLWVWGSYINGRLGNGPKTVTFASSAVQTIAGGKNWKSISSYGDLMVATKTDGTLWLWGDSNSGSLGNMNGTDNISSPVQTVAGGTNWKQASAGKCITGATTFTL